MSSCLQAHIPEHVPAPIDVLPQGELPPRRVPVHQDVHGRYSRAQRGRGIQIIIRGGNPQ